MEVTGGSSTRLQCRRGPLWKLGPRPRIQDAAKPSALRERPCGGHHLIPRVVGVGRRSRDTPTFWPLRLSAPLLSPLPGASTAAV